MRYLNKEHALFIRRLRKLKREYPGIDLSRLYSWSFKIFGDEADKDIINVSLGELSAIRKNMDGVSQPLKRMIRQLGAIKGVRVYPMREYNASGESVRYNQMLDILLLLRELGEAFENTGDMYLNHAINTYKSLDRESIIESEGYAYIRDNYHQILEHIEDFKSKAEYGLL